MRKRILSAIVAIAFLLNITFFMLADMLELEAAEEGSIRQIEAGNGFYMLVMEDGSLWGAGYNRHGQLGDGTKEDKNIPVKIMDEVKSIKVYQEMCFAIKEDSSLWTWGRNDHGQLGDGTKEDRTIPMRIMDSVASVSISLSNSTAIKNDGSLWVWGRSSFGSDIEKEILTPIKKVEKVKSASINGNDLMIIKEDDSLWMWDINNSDSPIRIIEEVKSCYSINNTFTIKKDNSLWGSGMNYRGSLGVGTNEFKKEPVMIMDNVKSISSYSNHNFAIKEDNSLWAWGDNEYGQLGDGTKENRAVPVKIMDGVKSIETGSCQSLALKEDGSLWLWGQIEQGVELIEKFDLIGSNTYRRINENSIKIGYSPTKIMDGVKAISAQSNMQIILKDDGGLWFSKSSFSLLENGTHSVYLSHVDENLFAEGTYIYDSKDPGSDIKLPYEILPEITDKTSALTAIDSVAKALTKEQKASSIGVDAVTLFSEEAIAQSAVLKTTSSRIEISKTNIAELTNKAVETKEAAVEALSNAGIENNRELNADVKFKTTVDSIVTVTIDKTVVDSEADSIRVETPSISVSVNTKALKSEAVGEPLVITISQAVGPTALDWPNGKYEGILTASAANKLYLAGDTKTYSVSFNKTGLQENIKVSLPKASGDVTYQAVLTTDGKVVGGKYNPATDKLEIRTKTSGQYIVKDNKKDFTDIQDKSEEMQEAIKIMTSKGIMGGTTEKQFSPDQPISRAEIASYLLKTFSKLEPNADGGYSDVKKSDWYYGTAGSAKKYGIIKGFPDNTFKGAMVIPKDQLIAVAARTLKVEMKYKDPSDMQKYLSIYEDNSTIDNWAKTDVAFATRENLVMKRNDNKFLPKKGMTRGDAAIMLKRLFDRVW